MPVGVLGIIPRQGIFQAQAPNPPYRARSLSVAQQRIWFDFLAIVDGASWGGAVTLLGYGQVSDGWLITLLCGVAAVNAPQRALLMRSYALLLFAMWLPIAVYDVRHWEQLGAMPMLLGTTLCFAVLLFHVRKVNLALCSNIRLRIENEQLSEQLKISLVEVRQQAATDPLTGCGNRRAGEAALARALDVHRHHHTPVSIITMDLDFFKQINDTHGHAVGDAVLQQFVKRVTGLLRSNDILARIGGEEFMVVLQGATLEAATATAERLRAAIAATPLVKKLSAPSTISLGVAAATHSSTVEQIMVEADEALYIAKRTGRDRVCARPRRATA